MNQLFQNSESHELSDALENLGQEAGRLQTVIDTVPSILWTTFPDGSKEYLNKRWYEYTGLTEEQGKEISLEKLGREDRGDRKPDKQMGRNATARMPELSRLLGSFGVFAAAGRQVHLVRPQSSLIGNDEITCGNVDSTLWQ